MLRENPLKRKLEKGIPVLGIWSICPSPILAEIAAIAELDFMIIDREHGVTSMETALQMAISCEAHALSPMMRVSEIDVGEIQRALDAGFYGLHVPNIYSPSQLRKIEELMKYPPQGNRGFSPFTRAALYTSDHAQRLVQQANQSTLLAVHIEGKEALENLDAIIEHPAVDIVFIGLYDLSKSIGKPGETAHPDVENFLKKAARKVREKGKAAGTIASHPEQIKKFLDYGINYLTYSADCHILYHAYRSVVNSFKSAITL